MAIEIPGGVPDLGQVKEMVTVGTPEGPKTVTMPMATLMMLGDISAALNRIADKMEIVGSAMLYEAMSDSSKALTTPGGMQPGTKEVMETFDAGRTNS